MLEFKHYVFDMTSTELPNDRTPVVEYIRYRVPSEGAADFVTAYRAAAVGLRASPYCLGYELACCVEERDRFVLRIQWTSVDDHLNGFRRSPQFREFYAHIAPYVDRIDEMQHYSPELDG
jgi:quinol monooxygenase YgiN